MASGTNIRTYFQRPMAMMANLPIMRAADQMQRHGSTVFDGARYVNGNGNRILDAALGGPRQPLGCGFDDHADGATQDMVGIIPEGFALIRVRGVYIDRCIGA